MVILFRIALGLHILLLATINSHALDLDAFIKSKLRKAIVMVNVIGKTEGGSVGANSGSGFMISEDGHALTAAHLFYRNSQVNDPSQKLAANPPFRFVEGSLGSAGGPFVLFELESMSEPDDIALIKMVDPAELTEYLHVCTDVPTASEKLTIMGYLVGQGIYYPQGSLAGGLIQNRYPFALTIGHGMSGSAVLNDRGSVFGMGLAGLQGASLVLPSRFFLPMVARTGNKEDCSRVISSPPDEFAQYQQLMIEGDAMFVRDAERALQNFQQAQELIPDRWDAYYGLARVEYYRQNFAEANRYAELALSKAPTEQRPILLNISGLSLDAVHEIDAAKNAYDKILLNYAETSEFYKEALFSSAQIGIKLSMDAEDNGEKLALLDESKKKFKRYISLGGVPSHFAHYHLACIAALTDKQKTARTEVFKARLVAKKYKDKSADLQRSLLESRLTVPTATIGLPGEPVPCPKLVELANTWTQ